VLSWSVPAELAEMAETGGRAKTRVYADFKGLSREDGWCCQTGLNFLAEQKIAMISMPIRVSMGDFVAPLWR
jgi:hypothetical protein